MAFFRTSPAFAAAEIYQAQFSQQLHVSAQPQFVINRRRQWTLVV